MFGARGGAAIAGKAGYALCCAFASLVMVASGFAYYVKSQVASIGGSSVISGGASVGAMNILLMGLESRTYWNGEPLPRGLEDIMHIGSVGGNATNTLILVHIFAGGQKAVAFSIPRDDWVTFPQPYDGQAQGKIDQAYGFAMAAKESQLAGAHLSQDELAYQGNEAGRLAEIQTVEALTGVRIDHFAELNLDGFYELARVFDGIEVCVKSEDGGRNLTDANSGAHLKVGYQHLDAAQALAFVRERDNLANGDLDRTHRQQAVIDYVIWKLKTQGVLADLGQLSSLLTVAKQYLITDRDWNLLDFLSEMRSLTGKNLTFRTLPITGYQTIDGQAANVINPAYIKQVVNEAFYPPAPSQPGPAKPAGTAAAGQKASGTLSPGATTVDIYNGGYTSGLAGQLSQALAAVGYKAGKVGNIPVQSSTEVRYGAGAAAAAQKIAGYFTDVTASPDSTVAAGHVEVLLGTDATAVPAALTSPSPASGSPPAASAGSPSPSSSALNPSQSNGANGGAVTVKPNAPYGIPCVY
ncbi:MAG TPA: LCP family protein [Trebonia sp.]|jgi:LCP family protein required for cell wall assembly|nr:LCP family protein [Trebonia sp.]